MKLVKADPPLIQEVWYRLQGWYKAALDRAPPPARATIKRVTAEWVALYSRIPPPGDNILVTIEPFAVEDGIPTEAEIEWAVKRLQNNRAGGPSRMRAEDLKGWLAAARRGGKERYAATKDGGGFIRLYSVTPSAVTRLSVDRAGGGARSTAALYHP